MYHQYCRRRRRRRRRRRHHHRLCKWCLGDAQMGNQQHKIGNGKVKKFSLSFISFSDNREMEKRNFVPKLGEKLY